MKKTIIALILIVAVISITLFTLNVFYKSQIQNKLGGATGQFENRFNTYLETQLNNITDASTSDLESLIK